MSTKDNKGRLMGAPVGEVCCSTHQRVPCVEMLRGPNQTELILLSLDRLAAPTANCWQLQLRTRTVINID